ncbi:hypothetical protein K461DRAFT_289823 [Myriangium duriaei CBS 260.36]|uniref:Ion transport domain-containing protein n=1 Tax=Myriangium duriaei CBS 260.36 TaxID=1168546 RepID=A0A9P4J9G6_9PEZI|nr:hypothetical protein K461DRAFT_289823 [Myriangium duriaei CBS 260.36]
MRTGCASLISTHRGNKRGQVPSGPKISRSSTGLDNQIIDLYFPAPSHLSSKDTLSFHLTTRNLFAWIMEKPLVGNSLGRAMIELYQRMVSVRPSTEDNLDDCVAYAERMGYLYMTNQPDYALAMLAFSEKTGHEQIRTNAFVHCVGMNDMLCLSPEFDIVSGNTKAMIAQEASCMNSKVKSVVDTLPGFFEAEIDPTILGLTTSQREDLEQFRLFLRDYYISKYGYWPLPQFTLKVLQDIRFEFECLFELLVHRSMRIRQDTTSMGELCILQNIRAFDQRHGFTQLEGCLPRLPLNSGGEDRPSSFRRLTKFARLRHSNQSLLAEARSELVTAVNQISGAMDCEMVKSYLQFEQNGVTQLRPRSVTADARTIRWLQIYYAFQMLKSITDTAPDVILTDVPAYHTCCSIPPVLSISSDGGSAVSFHSWIQSYQMSHSLWPTMLDSSSMAPGANSDFGLSKNDMARRFRSDSLIGATQHSSTAESVSTCESYEEEHLPPTPMQQDRRVWFAVCDGNAGDDVSAVLDAGKIEAMHRNTEQHSIAVLVSPFSSPFTGSPEDIRTTAPLLRGRQPQHDPDSQDDDHHAANGYDEDEEEDRTSDDMDEDEDDEPLLPIFSAAHLDILPVYNTTHAIRMLIVPKCETTLSWDQLRTPQISQFLVKPIQEQIRANHFNRATLLALIANCLQFKKEAETNLGNAGVNKTRALLAELLAMRLLREYSTRELIDALSYDFDPLKGMGEDINPNQPSKKQAVRPRSARISTVEIAIRATAKKFLAHPLVVQQLEAVWAGSIVFHSAADNLHRKPPKPHTRQRLPKQRGYGTLQDQSPSPRTGPVNGKAIAAPPPPPPPQPAVEEYIRRSVTLYDPRDASLFKLSRLRVPRYRQLFSTLSFAVMLGLFLAVLLDRSLYITPLEIVFWLYSAGYMLDEVVGFTEQGFGLYIISVWNAFDLGILILFFVYYILRLYGIVIDDVADKHRIANTAYDVLASTAVLLFPRAFNILDHYRYFSQLLIAFRMMAQDLVAVMVLILISCSGFFVAFTLSFSDETMYGTNVAYGLFQLVMGFTPTAWSYWEKYNALGRIVLTIFLFICHFLIVTILVSVLSNSFMAVVQNANEEHQFLFAVNTISMVKSDALFSYIPPTNLVSWTISPLRFIMPFRQFVKINRTIIKVTHFPILFSIFTYERLILSKITYEPTDMIERPMISKAQPVAFGPSKQAEVHRNRLREPSVVSYRKDQALDEVFRRPFRGSTVRTTAGDMEGNRRKSSNVVDNWMKDVGKEGGASPPQEQPRSVLDRLEMRRPLFRRALTADRMRVMRRDVSIATRSVLSDPEDRALLAARRPKMIEEEVDMSIDDIHQDMEGDDGDDELMTHDEADLMTVDKSSHAPGATPDDEANKENMLPRQASSSSDYFNTPVAGNLRRDSVSNTDTPPAPEVLRQQDSTQTRRPQRSSHDRNISSSTMIFQPQMDRAVSSSSEAPPQPPRSSRPGTARQGTSTPMEGSSQRGSRQQHQPPSRLRPLHPPRHAQHTAPDLRALTGINFAQRHREPSFNAMALDLASDLGDNRFGPNLVDVGGISGMPASFSEQMLRERELSRRREDERRRSEQEEKEVLGRMVLTRMNTLELGFREVISAVREMRAEASRAGTGSERGGTQSSGERGGMSKSHLAVNPTPTGEGSGVNSTTSSVLHLAAPRTPGGSRTPGGAKEKRSPKKIKRPTALRYDSNQSAAPAATGPSYAAVAAQPSSEAVDVPDETRETIVEPKGKGKEQQDNTSPNSVKNLVQNLERRESQKRSSSLGPHRVGEDRAASPGPTDVAPTVGTRRQAQSGEEAATRASNRSSVIYVGTEKEDSNGREE